MTKKRNKLASGLDAAVSLLAGGSAAFVLFAMPEGLLARAFAGAGLASFSPKFRPPFGADVRFGLVAAGGLLVLAFTWSLMKALDRAPVRARQGTAPEPVPAPEAEPEAPRVRKADAHPDAPARRPLLAGRDLGEPLELQPEQALPVAAEAEDADDERQEEFVPQPDPVPAVAETPEPAPTVAEAPAPLPPFLVAQEEEEETEAEPLAAAEPEQESAETISSLMRRFETGLGRKKQALPERISAEPVAPPPAAPAPAESWAPAPAAEAKPEPVAGPAPVGHRLRSAIADLQKVANR
jgi:hypothetical protein